MVKVWQVEVITHRIIVGETLQIKGGGDSFIIASNFTDLLNSKHASPLLISQGFFKSGDKWKLIRWRLFCNKVKAAPTNWMSSYTGVNWPICVWRWQGMRNKYNKNRKRRKLCFFLPLHGNSLFKPFPFFCNHPLTPCVLSNGLFNNTDKLSREQPMVIRPFLYQPPQSTFIFHPSPHSSRDW